MTEVQALLTGLVRGGLARAKADGYSTLEIESQVDGQGDSLPSILAGMNGERYLITVAPVLPEAGHYLVIHLDGQVALLHPVTEPAAATCAVSQAYLGGELPVLDHGPGRYAVWRGLNDVDHDQTVWHLDRLPDGDQPTTEEVNE